MSKTILILGGAYAGLQIAQTLLKKQHKDVKVVLVTKVYTRQTRYSPFAPRR